MIADATGLTGVIIAAVAALGAIATYVLQGRTQRKVSESETIATETDNLIKALQSDVATERAQNAKALERRSQDWAEFNETRANDLILTEIKQEQLRKLLQSRIDEADAKAVRALNEAAAARQRGDELARKHEDCERRLAELENGMKA